jgi:hypothetical protein
VGVSHVGDLGHGHRLADPVDHVGDVNQAGAGSYLLFVCLDDLVVVLDGEVETDLLVDNAIALGPLPVGLDHVGIVLLGADDFVAAF